MSELEDGRFGGVALERIDKLIAFLGLVQSIGSVGKKPTPKRRAWKNIIKTRAQLHDDFCSIKTASWLIFEQYGMNMDKKSKSSQRPTCSFQ